MTAFVARDELIDAVWGGRIISDAALSSSIMAARRAMNDSGREQAQIRTYHGQGFRFVGAIEEVRETGVASLTETDDVAQGIDLSLPERPSIAVLPFQCLGEEKGFFLAHGLTQDITVGLARTRWLFVSASASARRLVEAGSTPETAAKRLGVRYLVSGSLMQTDKRFRLSVSMCDTFTGNEVWADTYDRTLDDIFGVQTDIAGLVVAAVEGEIEHRERQSAVLRPIESLDAWSAYHRANNLLFTFSPNKLAEAEHLLIQAAKFDPGFARVSAARSFLYWQRAFLEIGENRDDDVRRAVEFAQQGVALDPHDPLTHWSLGRTAFLTTDATGSIEPLNDCLKLNPSFAAGHYALAYGQMLAGKAQSSNESGMMARRISPYDPMSFAFLSQLGVTHTLTGDAETGASFVARALQQPNHHFHVLAIASWVHQAAGKTEAAKDILKRLKSVQPDYDREMYFRAFPFLEGERRLIEGHFDALGL